MHRVDGSGVEGRGARSALLRDPAHDLRHVLRRPVRAARIDALGREGEVEVLAGLEARGLEPGQQLLARRARVRGRLEHDEMPLAQPFRDLLRRLVHDREVGLALLRERRRQRDHDRVRVAQLVVVGRRAKPVLVDEPLQHVRRNVLDVALAAIQHGHALGIAVDQQHAAARLREDLGERDADVAGSDNGDVGHRRGIVQSRCGAVAARTGRIGKTACMRLQSLAAGR